MLDCDADRRVYLPLLREYIEGCRVSLIGYCLMSNHVHLVLEFSHQTGLVLCENRAC